MNVAQLELVTSRANKGNNIRDSVDFEEDTGRESRYRLWSLLEMLKFYAAAYSEAIYFVGLAEATMVASQTLGAKRLSKAQRDECLGLIKDTIGDLAVHVRILPLSLSVKNEFDRLHEQVKATDGRDWNVVSALLRNFHASLTDDLASSYFLAIPQERSHYYEKADNAFGNEVANEFPEATEDIAAASRCLALDEWTASVFHLMRIAEIGLHRLAKHLEIPMADTVNLEQWGVIIDQIQSRIGDLEQQLPKSRSKSDKLQAYSDLATKLMLFKLAWRNHVSHSRATYDERQATRIWGCIEAFMEELASNVRYKDESRS